MLPGHKHFSTANYHRYHQDYKPVLLTDRYYHIPYMVSTVLDFITSPYTSVFAKPAISMVFRHSWLTSLLHHHTSFMNLNMRSAASINSSLPLAIASSSGIAVFTVGIMLYIP